MAKVGIVMGSDSDLKVMSKAADMLEELGIEYELTIISAHREPDELIEWTRRHKILGRVFFRKDNKDRRFRIAETFRINHCIKAQDLLQF